MLLQKIKKKYLSCAMSYQIYVVEGYLYEYVKIGSVVVQTNTGYSNLIAYYNCYSISSIIRLTSQN